MSKGTGRGLVQEGARHERLPLLIVGAVAASTTALLLAVTGSAQPQGRVIHVSEHEVQFTDVDHPPKKKLSQGDEFAFRTKLFDTSEKQIGSSGGSCVFLLVTRHKSNAECTRVTFLPEGKITAIGGLWFRPSLQTFTLPVVGGTRAYNGAEGTLVIEQLGGNKLDLTFNLKP
jgi:hypothetical protein